MGDNFSEPLTIRLSRSSRRKVIALAEKNATTTAAIVRQIVDDHLAGNDIEHRIRTAHEQTLKHTMESVISSVEEALGFAIVKLANGSPGRGNLQQSEEKPQTAPAFSRAYRPIDDDDRASAQPVRKTYNRTLMAQGRYAAEITPEIKAEAERRDLAAYGLGQEKPLDHFVLEVLNEGWKPKPDWEAPMRIPG